MADFSKSQQILTSLAALKLSEDNRTIFTCPDHIPGGGRFEVERIKLPDGTTATAFLGNPNDNAPMSRFMISDTGKLTMQSSGNLSREVLGILHSLQTWSREEADCSGLSDLRLIRPEEAMDRLTDLLNEPDPPTIPVTPGIRDALGQISKLTFAVTPTDGFRRFDQRGLPDTFDVEQEESYIFIENGKLQIALQWKNNGELRVTGSVLDDQGNTAGYVALSQINMTLKPTSSEFPTVQGRPGNRANLQVFSSLYPNMDYRLVVEG